MLLANQSSLDSYDVIVIGSGISGLTIALILAKEGKKVALFERNRDIAPLIRPYKRDGCEFSPGLHISGWMDEGEAVASFFKYLNLADGVEKKLYENGFGDVIVGGNKYHFPRGYDNVEKSLLAYFPESAQAIDQYMRLLKELNETTFYLNHELSPTLNKTIKLGGMENATLQEFLQQYNASQGLIDVLGTFNYTLMGSKAAEVPFIIHAFLIGGFYRSPGFFTANGMKRLLTNFKRELNNFGVGLFLSSEIDEILVDDNRNAIGVKTAAGHQYAAATIIASFNPKLLNETVAANNLRPIYRQRLTEAENTFGLFVAFYKIRDQQTIEFENFVYYNDSLDLALGAVMNHSNKERIISVILAANDPRPPADSGARKNRAAEKLALLERIIYDQAPGLKGRIELLDFLKPWSFERYTETPKGSAYGIKQTANSIGFQHRVPVRGLYLVGQSIYPGFLGAMISSFSMALELSETTDFWPRVINQWN